MKHLELIRVSEHKNATLGVLVIDGQPSFVTLEDAWNDNEKMVSCIPEGKYILKRHQSPKFGDCFQVMDVPNRDHILIHWGNTHKDTNGCILLGMSFGTLGDDTAIMQSKVAFTTFKNMMINDYSSELVIKKGF